MEQDNILFQSIKCLNPLLKSQVHRNQSYEFLLNGGEQDA